jgi:hypothetical protein
MSGGEMLKITFESSEIVSISPMSNAGNEDDFDNIINAVYNPVVTDTKTIKLVTTFELDDS